MRVRLLLPPLALLALLVAPVASAQQDPVDASVVCESRDNRYTECHKPVSGHARLIQKKSQAGCAENHSWGQNDRVIWVDNGCRAVFAITADRGYRDRGRDNYGERDRGLPPTRGYDDDYRDDRRDRRDDYRDDRRDRRDDFGQITCESIDERYQRCDWPRRWGEPVLVEQLSRTRCVEDRNWGYSRRERAIWVDDGCRARFESR